jgi:hypothetical protein
MAFLQQHHVERDLEGLVTAVNSRTPAPLTGADLPRSLQDMDALVVAGNGGAPGMPVLLRQYLKLDAKLLGFNLDPAFGYTLDALMMVDLVSVAPAILNRLVGKSGAAALCAYHRDLRSPHAA